MLQELYLYLHLLDIYTVDTLKASNVVKLAHGMGGPLSIWDEVPAVICITIVVPRKQVKKILDGFRGTPPLCCTVESSPQALHPWSNVFGTVQTGFGTIKVIGQGQDSRLEVDQDHSCWHANSPLIASFYLPAWILLHARSTPVVRCGLLSTPGAVAFLGQLGLQLALHETTLDKCHITRNMPNMSARPIYGGGNVTVPETAPVLAQDLTQSISVTISSQDTCSIADAILRIDFMSEAAKAKLFNKELPVTVTFYSPITAGLFINGSFLRQATFPLPVNGSKVKLRIARKSGYVEIVVPILRDGWKTLYPHFMLPASLESFKGKAYPVMWSFPRTNVSVMPEIDTHDTGKIPWLTTHVSLTLSARERAIRESGMAASSSAGVKQDVRVDLKDGIFSMFMHSSGMQGRRAQLFGLTEEATGINMLFLVSSLKLDLAHRAVLLDAAVIPLTSRLMRDSKMPGFLHDLTQKGIYQIK